MSSDSAIPATATALRPRHHRPHTRVLMIEDDPVYAHMMRVLLETLAGEDFEIETATDLAGGAGQLRAAPFDIVLLDLSLPDSHGVETFLKLHAMFPDQAVIVLTGLDDEEVALGTVKAGAQDYLVKGQVEGTGLLRAIRYAVGRSQTERALRDSEALHQSLVETLPQYVYRKDPEGRFTFANRRFCAKLKCTPESIVGRTDFDYFPQPLAAKYQEDDRQVLGTGQLFETVEEHTPPGGTKEYVQVVKAPIRDALGKIVGTQGLFWDVTERKLAEEQLKKALWELAQSREQLLRTLADLQRSHNVLKETQLQMIEMEKMQSVGQLAAGIAHEVKNPLAILRMGLDFLAQPSPASAADNAAVLNDMQDALHRADTIIRGLLEFSAPGQLALVGADVNALLEESLTLVRHELASPDITVNREFAQNLPPALVDANKVKQVFVNLLTNAAHAMPEGGTLTIRTTVRRQYPDENKPSEGSRQTSFFRAGDQLVVVEIEDTGTGIAEAHREKVGEPFFTTKPTGKGTGLGLPVTKKIIELHHGTFQIKNREPNGVRATVTLRTQRK